MTGIGNARELLDAAAKKIARPLSRIPRSLSRNLGLRIVSLAIAAGLWLFVNTGQRNAMEPLDVPVAYRGLHAGLVIVNHPPDSVKIQVNGPRTLLSLLAPERLAIKIDLSGLGPGPASFKINPSMFSIPRQTTISAISPSEIAVDIDRIITRDLPVHVDVEGQPANGYEVAGVRVNPATVTTTGPSRWLTPLQQIVTEPFDVKGAADDVSRRVFLQNSTSLVTLRQALVDATVEINEKIVIRQFRGLSVQVRDSGDYKFDVDPNRANLTLRGPAPQLDKLDPARLLFVDAKELNPGAHEIPVQVNLPDGIQVVRQYPRTVKLRLYRDKRNRKS